MTLRPAPGESFPTLVEKSRTAIENEAESLPTRVKQVTTDRQPSCPHDTDNAAWKKAHHKNRAARRQLMQLGQHQARLVYTSAYDHLVTTGRVLGSDGRVSLYAHTSLARSVCEAAVRHNWLLDTSVDHETRLLRSAVALYSSELNRLKGVKEIPEGADHVAGKQREQLISACEADVIKLEGILASAGINSVLDRRRRKITTHLELSSGPRVPMQFETGPMMIKLLPESPSWYTIS